MSKYLVQHESDVRCCPPVAVVVECAGVFEDAFDLDKAWDHLGVVVELRWRADVLEPRKIDAWIEHRCWVVYAGFIGVSAAFGCEVPSCVEGGVCVDKVDRAVWYLSHGEEVVFLDECVGVQFFLYLAIGFMI